MTVVVRYPNGDLEVPVRVEGPGGLIGDSTERIGRSHPDYDAWVRAIARGACDVVRAEEECGAHDAEP